MTSYWMETAYKLSYNAPTTYLLSGSAVPREGLGSLGLTNTFGGGGGSDILRVTKIANIAKIVQNNSTIIQQNSMQK